VFKRLLSGSRGQILLAPVRVGRAASKTEWIPITDGHFSDDKPQISADGNTVYFTSDRDGYLCIWAQRLNGVTKHPAGAAFAFQHFHNSLGRNAASDASVLRMSDLTVGRDKILINLPIMTNKIWITRNN
jgi:eukaryotic-like serine/threonine-protein kinase